MSYQAINNGEAGLSVRTKLNSSLNELYNSYLPLSGGTFTNTWNLSTYTENKVGISLSANQMNINMNLGSYFSVSLNMAVTSFNISNVPSSGRVASFTLETIGNNIKYGMLWGSNKLWTDGLSATPTWTSNKKDIYSFLTYDAGTTWYSFIGGQNFG